MLFRSKEEPQLLKFEAGELKSVPMEAVFSVLPSDDQATMISYKNSLFKNVLKQIREKQLELLRSSVEACKKDSTFETKSGQ